MSLQLSYAQALWLLAILPLFWWIWRGLPRLRGRSAEAPAERGGVRGAGSRRPVSRTRAPASARRRVVLALRLTTVVLLVLALAGPQTVDLADELQVVFVVDRSKSIPGKKRQAIEASLKAAATLMTDKDRAGLVVFGNGAALESRPNYGRIFHGQISALVADDLTNIEVGLREALASFPDGVGKRIVLITDGNENRGSLLEMAALCAANHVQVDVVPIRYDYPHEVFVEKVVLPARVNFGEPFYIRTVLNSTVATRARLSVFENQKLLDVGDAIVDVPVGKSVQTLKLLFQDEAKVEAIRKGFYVYEVRVTPLTAEGGADIEDQAANNSAIAFTQVQGRPAVLLIDGNEQGGETLAQALQSQGILVKRIEPLGLPENIVELQGYDCIILSNVGAENFTPGQMAMLKSNVRDVGGGLIMIGGENSFGAGGWLGTPVEEVLPVQMDLKEEKILPNGALCCIMHTCEFPNGNVWAKDICIAAMNTLSAQDYFGIVYYPMRGGDCAWGFREQMLKPVNKVALRQIIRKQLDPGDMPDYDNAFGIALKGMLPLQAALKHMIVISDGDAQPPSRNLVQLIRNSKITVSAIAIAPHGGGTQTLQNLARDSGGNFYHITDPRKLPRIFVHEAQVVRKAILVEKPLQPVIRQLTEPVLGVVEQGVPMIEGYVATTARPLADVPLTAEGDMPLLAHWRYGLGRTLAYTSDAKNRWGQHWVSWATFAQFWGQQVRWCQKSVADANYEVRTSVTDGRAVIAVDAVDDEGRFKNNLQVKATLVPGSGEGEVHEVILTQTAPGHYEAEVEAGEVGAYLVNLLYEEPPPPGAPPGTEPLPMGQTAGSSVPYSPEFRQLTTNVSLLERVAEMTGGHVLAEDFESRQVLPGYSEEQPYIFFLHDHAPSTKPRDRWQTLLLLAAMCFLLDVFVRRVMIDYGKIFSAFALVLPFLRSAGARAQAEAEKLAAGMRAAAPAAPGTPAADGGARSPSAAPALGRSGLAAPAGGAGDTPRTWLATDTEATAAGAEAIAGDQGGKRGPATPPAAPAAEGGYTNRLLEAKRRARRSQGGGRT